MQLLGMPKLPRFTMSHITKIAIWVLAITVPALFGWVWNTQTKLTTLSVQMDKLSEKNEADDRQDKTIGKFWKLHSWARLQINHLEQNANKPVSGWPSFDGQ